MKVSVIIPVYNAAPFVEEAVISALQQEETGEVILIEDGSTDNSLEICKKLSGKYDKVCLYRHEGDANLGAGESRNVGIRNARFDFIAFLDADDYYLENRFKTTVKVFENNTNIDGVYEAVVAKFESKKAEKLFKQKNIALIATINKKIEPKNLFDILFFGGFGQFHTDGITVKKNLFEKSGLFDDSMRISQDSQMWYKISAVGSLMCGSIEEPVSVWRIHENNRITKVSKSEREKIRSILWDSLYDWSNSADISFTKKSLIKFNKFHFKSASIIYDKTISNRRKTIKKLNSFMLKHPINGFIVWIKFIYFYLYKIKIITRY
jgi:glycosyltransferase involved in cell wall biosynthesis